MPKPQSLYAHLLAYSVALFFSTGSLASAAALRDAYIPPEVAFADDIRQQVTVAEKININRSNLFQLQALPGMDEELALKVMRNRPFEDVQEFYKKMSNQAQSGLDKKNIDRLIRQLQPKILYK